MATKTKTVDAGAAFTEVQNQAERICNKETQRVSSGAGPGDTFVQGDVYFTVLGALPGSLEPMTLPSSLQLAIGSTQGSRHCLDSAAGVRAYRLSDAGMLDGPILVLECDRTVTHPEHGHVILPAGTYAVSYQRSLDSEEREQRVAD